MVVVVVETWGRKAEGERKRWSRWNARFLFLVGERESMEGCVKNSSLTTLEKYPVFLNCILFYLLPSNSTALLEQRQTGPQ